MTLQNNPMTDELNNLAKNICECRKAKFPQIKTQREKLESMRSALNVLESQFINMPGQEIPIVDFKKAYELINVALAKNQFAGRRLERESIHIGVAGEARQGKSQFLQMLTGLGDEQIPTGDTGFCTASRSVIRNHSPQKATVYFMTPDDFMQKKVYYAYEGSNETGINLAPRPQNLNDFVNSPLPEPPKQLMGLDIPRYDLLKELHDALKNNIGLINLIGSGSSGIALNDVRKYITKDSGEIYHYVVDHVEVDTPFDAFPCDTTVYDVPGMNDPQPGIRETMFKSVTEDSDIVFCLKKPANTGGGWTATDSEFIGLLQNVYAGTDIKVNDWVQVVLNLDSRDGYNNSKQVEFLFSNSQQLRIVPVICDCGKREAVCAMVKDHMEQLVKKCAKIDDYRIREAEDAFGVTRKYIQHNVLEPLENALGGIVANQSNFDFDEHFEEFVAQLRGPIRKNPNLSSDLEAEIREKFEEECASLQDELNDLYSGDTEKKAEFPFDTKERLEKIFSAAHGPSEPVSRAVRNHREATVKLLHGNFDTCCEEIVKLYYDKILTNVFQTNKSINGLFTDIGDSVKTSKEKIQIATEKLRVAEDCDVPNICEAFENLLKLNVTFEGNILPCIYETENFKDFEPDDPSEEYKNIEKIVTDLGTQYEKQSEVLFNWLYMETSEIFSAIGSKHSRKPFSGIIANRINYVLLANYKKFVYQLIWGDETESEWKRYAKKHMRTLWPDEIAMAEKNSTIAGNWKKNLKDLENSLQ